jgi:CRP-like cAMP-binding protein
MTIAAETGPVADFLELRSIPWLEGVETSTLQVLAEQLESVHAEAGTVLSAEDDLVDRVLLVRRGALSVKDGSRARRATVDHPAALLLALAGRESSVTITAATDADLFAIHVDALWEALEEDFTLLAHAIELLADVLAASGARPRRRRSPEVTFDGEPDLVEQILWLRSTTALATAPVRSLGALARRSSIRELPDQTALYGKNDRAVAMFFVLSGAVREGDRVYGPGALVGELEAFAGRMRSADCRTLGPSRLLWLDIETVWDVLEDDFSLGRYLLGRLAREVLVLARSHRARV